LQAAEDQAVIVKMELPVGLVGVAEVVIQVALPQQQELSTQVAAEVAVVVIVAMEKALPVVPV